jgi:tyrosyl-tRNA synthetase
MKIDTDPKKIENFLTRGVENVYPNPEFVRKLLGSGKKLKVFFGIDPTGPTLHIGHAIQLRKIQELQKLGHEIIVLIGDFTAMIGDPTGKNSTRKPLSRKEVLSNCKSYKKQAGKFLKFGFGGAKMVFNADWLSKMKFGEVLDLASKMTVEQMLKRDMFEKRMSEGKPIYIHEFMYPLMQGYDSIVLKVDGEIGGNDQTFNMLTGRDLVKQNSGREKFVLTTKLLTDSSGKKMGKTEGNIVSMNEDEFEMFGKVMSWSDGLILLGLELCTDVEMSRVDEIKKEMENGANPRDAKVLLAKEIVKIYHGEEAASRAEKNFFKTFKDGGVPENIEEIGATNGEYLSDVSLRAGTVKSKGEFRRLVLGGAVSNHETGDKITDPNWRVVSTAIYKIGKLRFLKVNIK